MTIREILSKLDKGSLSKAEKGTKFEKFCKAYLKTDPAYSELEEVWLWDEFPYKSGHDIGIDLVGKTKDGEYWAVQSKFYDSKHSVSKKDIDTFLSASGMTFNDENGELHSFSRRILFSTTDKWNKNAENIAMSQIVPITRIGIKQLEESGVDWDKFNLDHYEQMEMASKFELRDHQKEALENAVEYYKDHDKGKLIMACGGGKTLTAYAIAREELNGNGTVLFLAPSISLVSQSLREWMTQSTVPIYPIVICSDNKASKAADEAISTIDLIHPATTNPETVIRQYDMVKDKEGLKVFFCTYQSIEVIEEVQKESGLVFDIIVCDEAHRTTGAKLEGQEGSYYLTVHNNERIPALKRLYMTATPRIYGPASKKKAIERSAEISSMDDEKIYGEEFYRLGFADAIRKGLLTDYKVMIITVADDFVDKKFRELIDSPDEEVSLDDLTRIYGIWTGLSKHSKDPDEYANDPGVMKRGIIYTNKIEDSKRIESLFNKVIEKYDEEDDGMAGVEVHHLDGTIDALTRSKEIDWLREETEGEECRILTNARCLSEGVDVPALDAVAFANPRSSMIDIIQSVGRVMRKDPRGNKKFGYIIIPVAVPDTADPDKVLESSNFNIVWNVLRALRAHDERISAEVNKLALNHGRKTHGEDGSGKSGGEGGGPDISIIPPEGYEQIQFNLVNPQEWNDAIFAKLVLKLGDSRYWESWAKDVAKISTRQIMRINNLLDEGNPDVNEQFNLFLKSLRDNLNSSITKEDAIEMISQHLITKPVFEALFEGYEFTMNNPVSIAMDKILSVLYTHSFDTEMESMESFYDSVRERVRGINNLEGRQRVITELYESFFKLAFRKQSEKLGIVYTPTEVVDFIINSIEVLLQKEFGKSLGDKGVEILDPFTGTGTFISRLISSGLIPKDKLEYKYKNEINANEIVLLAYYIASINIEETYHAVMEKEEYEPFDGIVLTDTFQIYEDSSNQQKMDNLLPENSERIKKQKDKEIQIILGNPPWSVGQHSQNDNAQNVNYPELNKSLEKTYVKNTNATLRSGLYDSYIKAFRWASDRLPESGGIIGFVTNGGFIDNQSMDGFRKCLVDEFTDVYVFNLRGNARTQGEQRRKERDSVFGQGTRAPVAITLLVKNPERQASGKVHYYDIGNYLSRDQKLDIIAEKHEVNGIEWELIEPDKNNDWINQCHKEFDSFILTGNKKQKDENSIFNQNYTAGVKSNRESWTCNYSKEALNTNIIRLINNFNKEVDKLGTSDLTEDDINMNPASISWTRSLKNRLFKKQKIQVDPLSGKFHVTMYRPYQKVNTFTSKELTEVTGSQENIFPYDKTNKVIEVCGTGAAKEFSALMINVSPSYHTLANGQAFPLYWYDNPVQIEALSQGFNPNELVQRDSISNWYLIETQEIYKDQSITKEDIFFYIYGILHSKEYREKFAADLKKSLPRIPFVKDFWGFSRAGRKLADLHLNYESIEPYSDLIEKADFLTDDDDYYKVQKMRFGKKKGKKDRSTIIYNDHITIENIPDKAYDYLVNGRSAIEWIMEQYRVKTDKDSGIVNDPNDWSEEVGNERYILDLLKSIVTVSVETVDIVNSLPEFDIIKTKEIMD